MPGPPRWWSTDLRRAMIAGLVFSLLWAALCNVILDVSDGVSLPDGFSWLVREAPLVFLVSTLLVWTVIGALVALTGRVILSATLLLLVVTPVALANHEKLALRSEPVYPSDLTFLTQPAFLADMVDLSVVKALVAVLVLVVLGALAGLAMVLTRRRLDVSLWRRRGPAWKPWLVARVVMLVTAVLVLSSLRGFQAPGNPVRHAYEVAGADWAPWSQKRNYLHHGVVAGLLYNLDVTAMDRPPGYDQARMDDISQRYQALADRMNRSRSSSTLQDTNVVVVLSEAFSDPTRVPGITLDEDPIPFTRSLLARTPSGSMRSPLIGGGTANIEFEVLTGQSISQFTPQMTTPYQMLVPEQKDFPSAVGYFEDHGHRTVAIHPFKPHMYQRDAVYPVFGFDAEVFEDDMHERHHIDDNSYIDDRSAFDEVLRTLDETDQPQFVQLVTMQNHYPMEGKYSDPIPATGISGDGEDQLSHYARGLRHSDDALKSFLTSLASSGKPTTVVFYGDHTPAFWVRDRSSETGDLSEGDAVLHETPYFLWSNRDDLRDSAIPVTSPVYLLPMLLNDLRAPLPPYYALLLKLQKRLPGLLPGQYLLPDGVVTREHDLDPRTRHLLEDYRLVQYDLSVGHRYVADQMFYPGASDKN